jgi:Tat protein secretion system quality control protein TatD with DNase activity
LTFEEANIVSSYYKQDGNHAAVTGGIGSQQLTDISNTIDLKLSKYDKRNRKHSFIGEFGIDHYTSASSDQNRSQNNFICFFCRYKILSLTGMVNGK